MEKLSNIGRIFYGMSTVVLGAVTICTKDFPYMLIPPGHSYIPGLIIVAYICGTLLILSGACIIFQQKTRLVATLLASVLLLVFVFYFVPYEFIATSNYLNWGEWENAEKELALSAGAFVIAGCFSEKHGSPFIGVLTRLIPLGSLLFCLTIICFGIDHFLFAKDAADYVPSWVPFHLFWIYFTGTALISAGVAIILKIKQALIATLLGTMIFMWFIMLHMPRVITSSITDMGSEVTSAFLALAYSGIAFVIAGMAKKQQLQSAEV